MSITVCKIAFLNNINPFKFNFSATRILPIYCLFSAEKRLVGY
jgi:hypothetical protein